MRRSIPKAFADRTGTDLLRGLSLAYRFFGWLFHNEPTELSLQTLREQDLLGQWPLPDDRPETSEGLSLLRNFLNRPKEEPLQAIRREYTELFIGPDHPLVLWESVWTTRDKLLFGEPTFAVRASYARHGVVTSNAEPDDHIALEMSFLGELLARAALALDERNLSGGESLILEACDFWRAHLAKWAGLFLQDLRERAKSDFYRGAALLALGTLATFESACLVAE